MPATAEQKAAKEAFKKAAAEAKKQKSIEKNAGRNQRTESRSDRADIRQERHDIRVDRVENRAERVNDRENRHQEKVDHGINTVLTRKEIARNRLENIDKNAAFFIENTERNVADSLAKKERFEEATRRHRARVVAHNVSKGIAIPAADPETISYAAGGVESTGTFFGSFNPFMMGPEPVGEDGEGSDGDDDAGTNDHNGFAALAASFLG